MIRLIYRRNVDGKIIRAGSRFFFSVFPPPLQILSFRNRVRCNFNAFEGKFGTCNYIVIYIFFFSGGLNASVIEFISKPNKYGNTCLCIIYCIVNVLFIIKVNFSVLEKLVYK